VALVVQFSAPRQVEVVEYEPLPVPPGHLRVRTAYSGISAGTELTAYRGTNPYLTRTWDPEARLFRDAAAGVSFPVAGWGYSETGEVVEVAPDVAGRPGIPAVGDQVWGIWGHRSEGVVPVGKLLGHQVPPGVDLIGAAFARVGAIALNSVLSARINLGELVAIFGQGVIGLLATRLAALSGAQVVTVDGVAARREQSVGFGAVEALEPGTAAERIRSLRPGGADTAIELSGAYAALQEAIRSVGIGGRVVASGFYQGEGLGLRLGEEFHHNRVELVSSQIGGVPPELAGRWSVERLQTTFLEQVGSGRIEVKSLVSHRVPVAEAAGAYALLDNHPGDALQILLEF
jgi:2-desacetyl-2-hydroxyethyl bacteriochlorophyllide A dehydrogenase